MNQRQFKRVQTLVNVLAHKINTNQNLRFADNAMEVTSCGTKGCVWGDFVVAMGGLNVAAFNKRFHRGHQIRKFIDFNSWITNPTLKKVGDDVADEKSGSKVLEYFGIDFDQPFLFGTSTNGTWEERYDYLMGALKEVNKEYNPLNRKITA